MNTIIDTNKLSIDADKAITLICLKFDTELLLCNMEIRSIPIKGIINKRVSNMCKFGLLTNLPLYMKFILNRVN